MLSRQIFFSGMISPNNLDMSETRATGENPLWLFSFYMKNATKSQGLGEKSKRKFDLDRKGIDLDQTNIRFLQKVVVFIPIPLDFFVKIWYNLLKFLRKS